MCVADFPKVSRSHSMKTSLVAFVLALSAIAVGQTTAPQSQAQPAGSQPAATQQPGTAPAAGQPGAPAQPQKKEIKDPAEYNAYVSAVQQKDPAAQISGLEAFLTQYPNSVVGFSALQLKDYANAQKYLRASVEANPNNLEDVYPLALAYLSANPPDSVNGIFFIARAADLAPAGQAQTQITNYGKSVYTKYHGSDQGWSDLLTTAKTTPLPPAGFTISQYVPPTPAEQAAELVKTKQPKEMSFAEWELVLSAGKPEDAEKVWNAIKGVPLQMEGQVIKASDKELQIAASQDDIDQKRADIILSMTGAIPPRLMPKEGSTLDFEGTPVSYTPSPFVMTMEKGALLTKAAPKKSPAHPARRRPTKPQ